MQVYLNKKYGREGHPASYLRNKGLRHSVKELENVFIKMHTMPIEQMAVYADQVTADCAKDKEFQDLTLKSLLEQYIKGINPASHNSTSIGNIAYMITVIENEKDPLRELCKLYIEQFVKYRLETQKSISDNLRSKIASMRHNRSSKR